MSDYTSDASLLLNDSIMQHLNVDKELKKIHGAIANRYEYIVKRRTFQTALAVIGNLNSIAFEEIGVKMYARVPKEMMVFVRQYEYLIEEAKLNPVNFLQICSKSLESIAKKIKSEQLWDEFIEFLHFWVIKMTRQINNGFVDNKVISSYMDLLLETIEYLQPTGAQEMLLGGCMGEAVWIKDPYPFSDVGGYAIEDFYAEQLERMQKEKPRKEMPVNFYRDNYKKYGYDISCENEANILRLTSRTHTNVICAMNYYISQEQKEILDFTPLKIDRIPDMPRTWRETQLYQSALRERNYILPAKGVHAEYTNAGSIKAGVFMEVLRNDAIVLLFRLITDNGDICGFYENNTFDFYCSYTGSNRADLAEKTRNFVLENYYLLTVKDIDTSKKKLTRMIVSDGVSSYTDRYRQQPVVLYTYKSEKPKGKSSTHGYVHYDRSKYFEKSKDVAGYIRRLPEGQQASEENISYARNLGLALEDGYTFVRPFTKKTHHRLLEKNTQ